MGDKRKSRVKRFGGSPVSGWGNFTTSRFSPHALGSFAETLLGHLGVAGDVLGAPWVSDGPRHSGKRGPPGTPFGTPRLPPFASPLLAAFDSGWLELE